MSNNYKFEKSRIPQGVDYESPYVAKNWNYIPDINSGIYANSGRPWLVNFDLTSIFNSQQLIDPSRMFVTIPIVLVTATVSNSTTGAFVAPKVGHAWICWFEIWILEFDTSSRFNVEWKTSWNYTTIFKCIHTCAYAVTIFLKNLKPIKNNDNVHAYFALVFTVLFTQPPFDYRQGGAR
jgi:hypothetical protein